MPDENGNLTRTELEAAIASGGSVLIDGQIFATKVELDAHFGGAIEARTAELEVEGEDDTTEEDKILAGNVEQVRAHIQTITDPEELMRLFVAESDREVARKGVLSAIEARTAELEAE